jgi:hypothetical protein
VALVVVTFDGTRLNDSDANTGWGNYGSGGGAPASEGANAYQISTGAGANTGVVGTAVKATTIASRDGIDYNGTAVDFTAAANKLFYCKCYVTDSFALNTTYGTEISLGSADQSNFHEYVMSGTDAALPVYNTWPAQGGYLITCIDPTIDTWANVADSGGTFDQTAVVWYGMRVSFVAANSKSENVAFDALDYGTGLSLLSGDTGTQGAYTDFYVFDQDDVNNRWGAAVGGGAAVTCRGIMSIGGSATATEFVDTTSVVTFPDGYHSRGLFGVNVNLDNASNVINDGALLIGQGTRNGVDANDTRPDYEVIGTTATSADFSHTLRNFRDVTYTNACTVDGANIQAVLLVQASATIQNSTIRANASAGVATIQDPSFGTTTNLHDNVFVQTGSGHAMEITTAGTYTLTGDTYTSFSASTGSNGTPNTGANDAVIYNNSGGAVTLNISGGDSPSIRNGASASTVVSNPVVFKVTNLVEGSAEIGVFHASSRVRLAGVETCSTTFEYAYNAPASATPVYLVVFGDVFKEIRLTGLELGADNQTIPVQQQTDRVYLNPA